mmetsp:Transcript_97011/g.312627  ORF Transcript_97011/g.312627 Transcript_97011/m.312627 type:complete len:404 (+) Transcript_97011:395-1606(+)
MEVVVARTRAAVKRGDDGLLGGLAGAGRGHLVERLVDEVHGRVVLLDRILGSLLVGSAGHGGHQALQLLDGGLPLGGHRLHFLDEVLGLTNGLRGGQVTTCRAHGLAMEVGACLVKVPGDTQGLVQDACEDLGALHQVRGARIAGLAELVLVGGGATLQRRGGLRREIGKGCQLPADLGHARRRVRQHLGRVATRVHREEAALGLASADEALVAVADLVALGAVAGLHLVVGGAIALAAVGQAEEQHVRHSAAELEADLVRHLLAVLLGHMRSIVHDGDVGHLAEFVRDLVVSELVAVLEEVILDAIDLVEPVLEHVREGLDRAWLHACTRDLQVGELALRAAVVAVEVHGHGSNLTAAEVVVALHLDAINRSNEERENRSRDLEESHDCDGFSENFPTLELI